MSNYGFFPKRRWSFVRAVAWAVVVASAACGADEAGKRGSDNGDASISGTGTTSSSTSSTTTNPTSGSTTTSSTTTNPTSSTTTSPTSSTTTNPTSTSTGAGGAAGSSTGSAGAAGTGGTGAGGASGADAGPPGGPCGYKNMGRVMNVGTDIQLCLPPVVCSANETCLPELGTCVAGQCVYKPGYNGLATLPQAWATQYCDLTKGTCNGIWHSPDNTPLVVAEAVGTKLNRPLCTTAPAGTSCVGIMAPPPLVVGNSQRTIDPATGRTVALWGLGTTWASGLCYEITGPGGTAVVAVTDRCAGYCNCKQVSNGQTIAYQECGGCIDSTTHTEVHPQCTCVGGAPPIYTNCCGRGCPMMSPTGFCDWCAANNHPHFDLDDATFSHVCGPEGPMYGSCQLSKARFLPCYDPLAVWPPR